MLIKHWRSISCFLIISLAIIWWELLSWPLIITFIFFERPASFLDIWIDFLRRIGIFWVLVITSLCQINFFHPSSISIRFYTTIVLFLVLVINLRIIYLMSIIKDILSPHYLFIIPRKFFFWNIILNHPLVEVIGEKVIIGSSSVVSYCQFLWTQLGVKLFTMIHFLLCEKWILFAVCVICKLFKNYHRLLR